MLEWEPFGCGPGFVVGTGRALVRGREGGSYPAAGLRGGGPCVGTAACGDLGGPVPVRGGGSRFDQGIVQGSGGALILSGGLLGAVRGRSCFARRLGGGGGGAVLAQMGIWGWLPL